MPGDRYTQDELRDMSREDFERAAANNFDRRSTETARTTESEAEFSIGASVMSATPVQINLGSAAPKPEPRADVWTSKKKDKSYGFTCPSGQTCRLRPLEPQALLEKGLLDQITRLEGLAASLVDKAEGNPPAAKRMPTREELASVLEVLNLVVPLAVAEPVVLEIPEAGQDRHPDGIYADDIDLEDRMAILEESLKGLKSLDRFRNP